MNRRDFLAMCGMVPISVAFGVEPTPDGTALDMTRGRSPKAIIKTGTVWMPSQIQPKWIPLDFEPEYIRVSFRDWHGNVVGSPETWFGVETWDGPYGFDIPLSEELWSSNRDAMRADWIAVGYE